MSGSEPGTCPTCGKSGATMLCEDRWHMVMHSVDAEERAGKTATRPSEPASVRSNLSNQPKIMANLEWINREYERWIKTDRGQKVPRSSLHTVHVAKLFAAHCLDALRAETESQDALVGAPHECDSECGNPNYEKVGEPVPPTAPMPQDEKGEFENWIIHTTVTTPNERHYAWEGWKARAEREQPQLDAAALAREIAHHYHFTTPRQLNEIEAIIRKHIKEDPSLSTMTR